LASPDLASLWQSLGWQPGGEQLQRFVALQRELRLWNSRLNLTRLVEGDDFWIGQVFDSLWPLVPLIHSHQQNPGSAPLQLVDVGTGGGFPGLALAIALPNAHLRLVDSVQRKVEAVRAMAAALDLADRVAVHCGRIEKLAHQADWRGQADWALARAVAPAPVVAEYLVPLLQPSGRALLYRGQWSQADQQELEAAARLLRATVTGVDALELPAGRGQRHALQLTPMAPCPRTYPRAVGIPAKQPLGTAARRP
jgi:16S rRNA (guanine527-N7)-methyltransferase